MAAEYQKAFRLRGIPGEYEKDGVRRLVKNAITRGERDIAITIESLSIDPRQNNRQTATLTFSRTPAALSVGQQDGQWPPFRVVTENGPDILLVADTHFLGFTSLHSPSDTDWSMDLIAVTGLGGHAYGSWKQKGGSFMWLQDALPQALPLARIMTYGYDTSVVESESFQITSDLALQFNRALRSVRRNPRVPLVIIAHSLGGIVVKEALLKLHDRNEFEDHTILSAIRGILFFGVPNQGMAIESLIPMVYDQPNFALLEELERGSAFLRDQSERFSQMVERLQNAQIVNFYETKKSSTARWHHASEQWKMTGPSTVLVTRESATHGRPYDRDRHQVNAINRNHSELVKFSSEFDEVYSTVLEYLQDMQPRTAFRTLSPEDKPLRLLSISGSGYRGLGALLTLRHLLLLVDAHSPPRPCEVFDIIAGSGTGGLIAILLGRFGLDIETAIRDYIHLSVGFRCPRPDPSKAHTGISDTIADFVDDLFDNASRRMLFYDGLLDSWVCEYVRSRTGNRDEKLLESSPKCKTFVLTSSPNGNVQWLRNYTSVKNGSSKLPKLKIWKACRATMATAAFFGPVKTKKCPVPLQNACIDYSNPVLELLVEAEREFPKRPISTVVSIQDCVPIGADGSYAPKSLRYADKCSKLDQSNARKEKVVRDMYCGEQGKLRNKYFSICAKVDGSIARVDDGTVRSSMEAQIHKSLSSSEVPYRDKLQICAWSLRDQ